MNYLSQSGPLVWLVLAVGLMALVWAIRFAVKQRPRDARTAVTASIGSAIVALLATVAGFQKSVGGLRDVAADDRWIYLWGLKESLNNLVLALMIAFLVTMLLMVGNFRRPSVGAS